MNYLRHLLHEWKMRRKIRAILAYNHAHPEECFDLGDYVQPMQPGEMPKPGTITMADLQKFRDSMRISEDKP